MSTFLEFLVDIVKIGASVAQPLALGGLALVLVFGAIYFILYRLDINRLPSNDIIKVLSKLIIGMFITGIIAIILGVSAWAMDRWWIKGYELSKKIVGTTQAIERKDFETALHLCKEGLEIDPNNAELYNFLGQIYYWNENFENAVDSWTKAYASDPDARYLYNLASGLTHLKEYSKALEMFKKAAKVIPPSQEDRIFYAVLLVLANKDNFSMANIILTEESKREGAKGDLRPLAFFELGVINLLNRSSEGYLQDAISNFEKAILGDRNYVPVLMGCKKTTGDGIELYLVEKEIIRRVAYKNDFTAFKKKLNTEYKNPCAWIQ